VAAVALAALGHVSAAGRPPSWLVTGLATGAVFLAALACSARERSFGAIAVAMLGVQGGLHLLFAADVTAHSSGQDLGGLLARLPVDRVLCAAGAHPAGSAPWGHLPGGGSMLAAHLVMALVLAWGLRCGEAALWSLARMPRRLLATVCRSLQVLAALELPAWPRLQALADRPRPLRLPRHRYAVVRRGPPVPVAA
jgi:hypothetical protein